MGLFLGIHKLPAEMTEGQVAEGYGKYKASALSMGLKPQGAIVSVAKGFAYCQTEAESADQVRQAHQKAEVPLEDVVEIKTLR